MTKKFTYTAISCLATGMLDCPVLSQTTSKHTVTSTLAIMLSSGATPTWATVIVDSVATTIAFGKDAKDMAATKGTPTTY